MISIINWKIIKIVLTKLVSVGFTTEYSMTINYIMIYFMEIICHKLNIMLCNFRD